ncbi:hypothetical protein O3P69_016170, partial [Scylla paramamosain]
NLRQQVAAPVVGTRGRGNGFNFVPALVVIGWRSIHELRVEEAHLQAQAGRAAGGAWPCLVLCCEDGKPLSAPIHSPSSSLNLLVTLVTPLQAPIHSPILFFP